MKGGINQAIRKMLCMRLPRPERTLFGATMAPERFLLPETFTLHGSVLVESGDISPAVRMGENMKLASVSSVVSPLSLKNALPFDKASDTHA